MITELNWFLNVGFYINIVKLKCFEDILLFLGEGCLYISPNNWYSTLNTRVHTYSHMSLIFSPPIKDKKVFLFNGLEQKIMCTYSKSVHRIEWQGVKERTVYLWKLETWFWSKHHSSPNREVSCISSVILRFGVKSLKIIFFVSTS